MYKRVCMFVRLSFYQHLCMYMCIYLCINLCVCVCWGESTCVYMEGAVGLYGSMHMSMCMHMCMGRSTEVLKSDSPDKRVIIKFDMVNVIFQERMSFYINLLKIFETVISSLSSHATRTDFPESSFFYSSRSSIEFGSSCRLNPVSIQSCCS